MSRKEEEGLKTFKTCVLRVLLAFFGGRIWHIDCNVRFRRPPPFPFCEGFVRVVYFYEASKTKHRQ